MKRASVMGYDVLIGGGLLSEVGRLIRECISATKAVIVTDETVLALYGHMLAASLEKQGFSVFTYAFPAGERSKNLQTLERILEFMAASEIGRSDVLVCLGGGVVGDIGGLAASLYARGMHLVQVPTTLLAAVDSSVGGKTAVNLSAGKNLAGAFYRPLRVICDSDILHMADGAAEVIKYAVLAAPELLDASLPLDEVIERCVMIKRDFVEGDERDLGRRQMLNLGHTIGHAVEKCSGYEIPHGAAVAIGLYAIARAAHNMGMADDIAPEIARALKARGLPFECPFDGAQLLPAMALDKKRGGDQVTLVVPRRIGVCELINVSMDALPQWLRAGGIACE